MAATALRYLGVPYVHGGASAAGVDCLGFLLLVYREAGYAVASPAPYARDWVLRARGDRYLAGVLRYTRPVVQPAAGDVVLFRGSRGMVEHAGIVAGEGQFIHALQGRGVIRTPLSRWQGRLLGYYRAEG